MSPAGTDALRLTETLAATKAQAEIEAMSRDEAIACALVWVKWNDAAQGYRVLAIWARANGINPRFVIATGVDSEGARKCLMRAHNGRRTPEVLDVLGADWSDGWTT